MTRKDYEKFARMFVNAEVRDTPEWGKLVEATADIFAEDNPRFRRDQFYAACGYSRS